MANDHHDHPGGHGHQHDHGAAHPRREGDTIEIDGGYQYRALTQGGPIQRYWHSAKLRLLDDLLAGTPYTNVLDLGCGSGVQANHLAWGGARVVGVDANPAATAFARAQFSRPNLTFETGLIDDLDLPPASFDLVVIMEVLEHLHEAQVEMLLPSVRRLMAPGGRLVLTTPNYAGTWPVLEWLLDRGSFVPHLHDDQHVSRWTRGSLSRTIEAAGFRVGRGGTYCTVAPFVAPVSRRLANRAFDLELRFDLRFGNLLYAVAENPV